MNRQRKSKKKEMSRRKIRDRYTYNKADGKIKISSRQVCYKKIDVGK